ncbi:MAG: CRISPR-associated endonuclease Cas2 [Helicobacteraceae bacterium]|jgi:CRISPR-associated protein Cas2|nr:CRISPR-associated endonuclease Cas2 [Helicobacteraceae bacterium]
MGRFVRLIVFFDLPVLTKKERYFAAKFRRFLINDGYDMVQFSIYARLIYGADSIVKHNKRLSNNLPPAGSVRSLIITEKQFAGIEILVGKPTIQEKTVTHKQLLLF